MTPEERETKWNQFSSLLVELALEFNTDHNKQIVEEVAVALMDLCDMDGKFLGVRPLNTDDVIARENRDAST